MAKQLKDNVWIRLLKQVTFQFLTKCCESAEKPTKSTKIHALSRHTTRTSAHQQMLSDINGTELPPANNIGTTRKAIDCATTLPLTVFI